MALKDVKITLPVNQPDDTLKLGNSIVKKHTLLDTDSPLNGLFNITDFDTALQNITGLRQQAAAANATRQSHYNMAANKCGIGAGQNKQTKDTIYWYVLKIRDFLLVKYRGTEEQLSAWGYNVVISENAGRKTVRVEIPTNSPTTLTALAYNIDQHHQALGGSSPIPTAEISMTAFGTLITDTLALLQTWEENTEAAQSLNNQALNLLGYAEGQNSTTPGTVYYTICAIRDRLLSVYQDTEEQLSEWGFKVVISSHKPGKKKGNTPPPPVN